MSLVAGNAHNTVGAALAAAVALDPARPLLTWYDDGSGDRSELSGATLDNWVAKTANLLVDGCGLGPGGRAAVLLPPHWQTAAVLLGCWRAGVALGTEGPVDVLFAAADRVNEGADWSADERYALALAPLAAPLREVPNGYADYVVEVRGHGDHFTPYTRIGPDDAAVTGGSTVTHGELCHQAMARAAELGIATGDRVMIDAGTHPDPLDWLLAPLLMGATTVLCARVDPDRLPGRAAQERVTVRL